MRVVLLVVVAGLGAGCVPGGEGDRGRTARAIERLAESQAKLREDLTARSSEPNLAPVLEELRRLRAEQKRKSGYTGALVHVDAIEQRCLPCLLLKRDLQRLARETQWTVGQEETRHWRLVPHPEPAFPVPRIEFVVDGRVVDVVEGYPNQPLRAGYFGPIDALIARHPAR